MAEERVWRVFYTFPRAEKKYEQRLSDSGIETYLPKHTVVRQWSDRKKKVVEPLFRNYIFARVDERDRLRALRTDGIVRCVSFQGQPAVVRDEEIEQIRLALDRRGCVRRRGLRATARSRRAGRGDGRSTARAARRGERVPRRDQRARSHLGDPAGASGIRTGRLGAGSVIVTAGRASRAPIAARVGAAKLEAC